MAVSDPDRYKSSQTNISNSDSTFTSRSSLNQIDELLSLLADLQIIDKPPSSASPAAKIDLAESDDSHSVTIDIDALATDFSEEIADTSDLTSSSPRDVEDTSELLNTVSLLSVLAGLGESDLNGNGQVDSPFSASETSLTATTHQTRVNLPASLFGELNPGAATSELNSVPQDVENPLAQLQNLIVEPELVYVKQALNHIEQKLTFIEGQVNDPTLKQKLSEMELQMQDASALNSIEEQLAQIAQQQHNLPTEIATLRQKLANIESQLFQPEELIKLLLPTIARVLSLKVAQSREEVCEAIVPIIDAVIQERSHQDKLAMSKALADIIPMAISQQIAEAPQQIAKAIAPEMGAAIREQMRLDRDAIASALAPEMGAAIKHQIELERDAMVDALYPVIGGTISKYLAEAIRSINQKIENTFSLEGIQRKMQAKMQGVSEAELILKEAMPFSLQALFLIHKSSGLIIVDVQPPDHHDLEPEMVAGMLTAIRSFANDCIARSGTVSELDQIDYGTSKILLEVAGYCYLAVVVQGDPSQQFIAKMRQGLTFIVQSHDKFIEAFDGDPDTVPEPVRSRLRTLMDDFQTAKSKPKKPYALVWFLFILLGLVLVPLGFIQYHRNLEKQTEVLALSALTATPELSIYNLQVSVNNDVLQLSGKLPSRQLRSKAMAVVQQVVPNWKIDNQIIPVHVPPDLSVTAAEVQRVTQILNRKLGMAITTKFANSKVNIEGNITNRAEAPEITATFAQIPGVQFVTSTLAAQPLQVNTRIYFDLDSAKLKPTEAAKLIEIESLLQQYPSSVLKLIGKSDRSGSYTRNNQLAVERAKSVRDALVQKGIAAQRLQVAGIVGSPTDDKPGEPLWMQRRVEFQPITSAATVNPEPTGNKK